MKRALLTMALTAALVGSPESARGASADGPVLHLSQDTANLGDRITVTGSGLVPGARYHLEICGIGGTSNSCAMNDAADAVADAHGSFRQTLPVAEPPTPCPCTVHAVPYGGAEADPVDAALRIPGLRYLPDAAPLAVGTAELLDATVADDSAPLTLLGADGSARVTVTFADLGAGPAGDPGIVLTLLRGTTVAAAYPVRWTGGPLAPGARRSLVYEVPLPGGWFRDFALGVGVAGAGGRTVTVRTLSASVRPWGELLAPAALLLGIGLIVLGRRRGRRGSAPAPGPEAPEASDATRAGRTRPRRDP